MLTAAIFVITTFRARHELVSPHFHGRGRVASTLTWDSQETITLASGHSVGWETAYRMRRPLPVALVWAVSLGQARFMPYAMALIVFAGNLLLAGVVADWLPRWRWFGGFVVLIPILLWCTSTLMPTSLGLGLAIWGWRKNNPWLLAAAGLVHETFLPFTIVRRRIAPFVVWVGWAFITVAVWGTDAPRNAFGFFAIQTPQKPWADALFILTIGAGLLSLQGETKWLSAMYLGLLVFLGSSEWIAWIGWARYTAPLWIFGLARLISGDVHSPIASWDGRHDTEQSKLRALRPHL